MYPGSNILKRNESSYLVKSGAARIFFGVNFNPDATYKQKKGMKDLSLEHTSKRPQGRSQTHAIDKPFWAELKEAHRDFKDIFFLITRESICGRWQSKKPRHETHKFDYEKERLDIYGFNWAKHSALLHINWKTVILYDANNFPYNLGRFVPQQFVIMKNGIIKQILRRFGLRYGTLHCFDVPDTLYSFGSVNKLKIITILNYGENNRVL